MCSMESTTSVKNYWKSLKQRDDGSISLPVTNDEFPEGPSPDIMGVTRRNFLTAAGFTFSAAALTGCSRTPVEKAIPYLVQPEAIVPGRSTHYASTCGACDAGCGLIVKNRDGRVIKLEGNPQHPFSRGGLCAVGQASVLGLYDNKRLQNPLNAGKDATWENIDSELSAQLDEIKSQGGAVRVLTSPVNSPSKQRMIDQFVSRFTNGKHVSYETFSTSAIAQAHEKTHGKLIVPRYLFDKAKVIVSFDADFLGTWLSPVAFTAGWTEGRNPDQDEKHFSYHVQFEGRMSVTGSKADKRYRVASGEMGVILSHLAAALAHKAGESFDTNDLPACPIDNPAMDELTSRLWLARNNSLVVCGSEDTETQVLCNYINHLLGNYGSTIDIEHPAQRNHFSDEDIQTLLQEIASGSIDALIINDVNPVYDLPNGQDFAAALQKVKLVISVADRIDETSKHATYVCPDHHYLESWGDVDTGGQLINFKQPTMKPLFNTRSILDSLCLWSGQKKTGQDIVRETWKSRVAWDQSIHDGFATLNIASQSTSSFNSGAVNIVGQSATAAANTFALVLYPKISMKDGRFAYNPWLQEMPDPITKVVWDNYASLSESAAKKIGVSLGDVIKINLSNSNSPTSSIELPVHIQPGQHDQTIAIALGYGREESARFMNVGPEWFEKRPTLGDNGLVGTSAAGLLHYQNGTLRLSGAQVSISRTDRRHELACTQDYHNIEIPKALAVAGMNLKRPNIQDATLFSYKKDGNLGHAGPHHEYMGELWPEDHKYEGHHWGMAIDLTSCTGCSGCVIACQVENNVPVVGRDEVRRKRIMHWMRVDRYYSDNSGDVDVAHQPMMCQHCDHAPCETVCPVLATTHSDEGLNQQTYNRCVGTRYCANNCPYKVRRFNWFEYAHDDKLANMSLNPDITIRSRGVMEKCSFCVQRIEEARIEAKRQGRGIEDGDIRPACQQSCPAGAIVFGDMNDPNSAVSEAIRSGSHYRVLEEINVRPTVGYLGIVRNREEGRTQTKEHNSHG